MQHTTSKILLLITALLFVSLYAIPSFCETNPYLNKKRLESTVSKIISVIMKQDVNGLMELSQMAGSFQFDKKDHITRLMKNYFNKTVETSEIEVTDMNIISDGEARVTVTIHLSAITIINDTTTPPRDEVWNFVKGKSGSLRGKWILVFD